MVTEQHQVPGRVLPVLPTGGASFSWSPEIDCSVPAEYLSGGCPVSFGWDGVENCIQLLVVPAPEGMTYFLL